MQIPSTQGRNEKKCKGRISKEFFAGGKTKFAYFTER
jgi:hypothetical protein